MKGVRRFRDRLKRELQDREFKKAFDEEELFAKLAIQIAKIREEQGLSQQDLAKRLRTSQQMVSRLEDVHNKSFSLRTLIKLARAFRKKIDVEFVP